MIGSRWVVCNKGIAEQPNIRARWVAQECRTMGGADKLRHEFYCGTQGLAVGRGVVSHAECLPPSEDPVLAVFDVRRAFF